MGTGEKGPRCEAVEDANLRNFKGNCIVQKGTDNERPSRRNCARSANDTLHTGGEKCALSKHPPFCQPEKNKCASAPLYHGACHGKGRSPELTTCQYV
jgi:hypothetical protein